MREEGSKVRLTHRTRCLNRCRLQIESDIQRAVSSEFRWLWRQLYPKLRRLGAKREAIVRDDYANHFGKAIDASSIWQIFQERIASKVLAAIEAGAEMLAQTENAFWRRRGKELDIKPADIVARYEQSIGRQIKDIGETTRRKISQEVIDYYNTPGRSLQELTNKTKQWVSDSKAAAIARTETTALNSSVTDETAQALGITRYTWQTRRDEIVCRDDLTGPDGRTYAGCRELHGKEFLITQKMPPAHVNCRCSPSLIIPGAK